MLRLLVFFHKDHRIIEFALRDLSGGKNCTFETLINPERNVPQVVEAVTKIGTDLVCRPDIPRFSDILPILLAYVRSHQAPGKPVVWVAHNAKNFDVPFLAQEFDRCSPEIPADWFFVDSMSLARKLVKSEVKLAGEKRRLVNLEALRKHYEIRSIDNAHRAMRDVTILCQVIQKITFDLQLTYEELRNESIRASDCRKLS
uniref:Exonuclease domain-containing protein n=1 Tax=Arundo donax TaxID=35708 RepID=A0A0A8Y7Z1_ARUDO